MRRGHLLSLCDVSCLCFGSRVLEAVTHAVTQSPFLLRLTVGLSQSAKCLRVKEKTHECNVKRPKRF